MSRLDALNAGALVLALVASVALGLSHDVGRPEVRRAGGSTSARAASLVDATGEAVPVRDYRRIVSASTIADELLLELAEPERVVAVTEEITHHPLRGHLYAGKATLADISDLEAYLALRPDLVLIHSFVDPRRVTRLREAGLTVFDLGDMRGLDALLEDIDQVATLLGHPERGARLASRVTRTLRAIASDVPEAERERAIYVAIHGVQLYGGTTGTSFHDVLTYAGLVDAAAERYRDWPALTTEQLLALDPPWIVTREGMRRVLCESESLQALRACAVPGHVVELPSALAHDAGLGMVDAAELVHAAVYGERPPREGEP